MIIWLNKILSWHGRNARRALSGQTAIILILLAAVALIFFAITLNWGRISETKVLTTIAANQSAASMVSSMASKGEKEWKSYDEFLKGTFEQCEPTDIIMYVIMIIIAVIVMIFTLGGGAFLVFLAVSAVVMSVVSLILQIVVVQPGITSMWNKMMMDQPQASQFLEQGISTAFQGTVTDSVQMTDYFDMNTNGRFGLSIPGLPQDQMGRYALFYTERLKLLQPTLIDEISTFTSGVRTLLSGRPDVLNCLPGASEFACQVPEGFHLTNPCMDMQNPYCNSGCVPPVPKKTWARSKGGQQVNSPTAKMTPAACAANSPYGPLYPYLYDPAYQDNYRNGTSFLEKIGRDSPMSPFRMADSSGLFTFLWKIADKAPETDNISAATVNANTPNCHWCDEQVKAPGVPITQCPAAPVGAGLTDLVQLNLPNACAADACCVNKFGNDMVNPGVVDATRVMDIVTPFNLEPPPEGCKQQGALGEDAATGLGCAKAPDQTCALGQSQGTGFWWKKGDDLLCSTRYPYNATCAKRGANGTINCSSGLNAADTWPEDHLDYMMHDVSSFVRFAQSVVLERSFSELNKTFVEWYPKAAEWIAPKCAARNSCTTDNPYPCITSVCNKEADGRLPAMPALFGQWQQLLDNWLTKTYPTPSAPSSPEAWCVPPATALNNISQHEQEYINNASGTPGVWAQDLNHVVACLDYNATNDTKFKACLDALTPVVGISCPATLPPACQDLPRSLVVGAKPAYDANCTDTGVLRTWVNTSYQLAINQSVKFKKRHAYLNDLKQKAENARTALAQAKESISAFLCVKNATYIDAAGQEKTCRENGPATQLMFARSVYQETLKELPNFVIYGWQDKNKPKGVGNTRSDGYWHIVKIRAYSPGRCGKGNACEAELPPWVKTWTKIIPGFPLPDMERCYGLKDHNGNVLVSVQRWDENHQTGSLFPNKVPLWKPTFNHPSRPGTGGVSTIGSECIKSKFINSSDAYGFGLTGRTLAAFNAMANPSMYADDKKVLSQAFMLNFKPTAKQIACFNSCSNANCKGVVPGFNAAVMCPGGRWDENNPAPAYLDLKEVVNAQACFKKVDELISRGVESRACARFEAKEGTKIGEGPYEGEAHFDMHFVDCARDVQFPTE